MDYLFQTGHGKGVARAEINAVLGDVIIDDVEDGVVLTADLKDPRAFLDRMGGIVRITQVLQSGPAAMPLNFDEWVTKALKENAKGTKLRFGLSMHPKSDNVLKKILNAAKNNLKTSLSHVRFVNKDFQNLSSVQAWHERLLDADAIELQLFKSEKKWYLCKTLAIQDFEWYSHRDYDRPSRSAKNGMFPPKVAQELINIAQLPEGTIYDPFCGSGTVLQEAWLMGFTVQGSDLSESCVEGTKENMNWIKDEARLDAVVPYVFHKDATLLTADDLPKESFAIVSETTLGPPLLKPLNAHEMVQLQAELEALYEAFFANLKKIAPAGTVMVFTAPYHRMANNERLFLPHLPAILKKYTEILPLSTHERPSLFFERKDQMVSREIWKVKIG